MVRCDLALCLHNAIAVEVRNFFFPCELISLKWRPCVPTGEKVRTLLHVQAAEHARDAATGVVAAAQREPVRDLLTQIVGMKHAPAFTSRAEPVRVCVDVPLG